MEEVGKALDRGEQPPPCPPLPGGQEEGQDGHDQDDEPRPKRPTWAEVASECLVVEIRPTTVEHKLTKEDGEYLRKALVGAILKHAESEERDNRPKFKRMVVTNYGALKLACEDEFSQGWIKGVIPKLPKKSTWDFELGCYLGGEHPFVPYTLRIKDPDWVENHQELIALLRYMNEGFELGQIGFGGVIKPFDKEKGGAVIRLLFDQVLIPVLESIQFAPRLQIGHVTLWGPGHRWGDRPRVMEDEVDMEHENDNECEITEANEMLNDTNLDAVTPNDQDDDELLLL